MSETQHLGRIIREKREKLKWSLEYTAEQCGISPRTLEDIELGKTEPFFWTVIKITNALDINLSDLESCRELYRESLA